MEACGRSCNTWGVCGGQRPPYPASFLARAAALFGILSTIYPAIVAAQPSPATKRDRPKHRGAAQSAVTPLVLPSDARTAGSDWSGLFRRDADEIQVAGTDDSQCVTPYLAGEVSSHRTWRVRTPIVPLTFDIGHGLTVATDRAFELEFSQETGALIQITSVSSLAGKKRGFIEPTAEVAARQMRNSGDEVYHSFAKQRPDVSFRDALAAVARAGGDVTSAEEIRGTCVVWSRIGPWREPRTVWAITLFEVHPKHAPADFPSWRRESYRYIVDAKTGEYLLSSNTPRYRSVRAVGSDAKQQGKE